MNLIHKFLAVLFVIVFNSVSVLADDSQILKDQITELRQKLTQLESQVAAQAPDQTRIEGADSSVTEFVNQIKINGMLDMIYSHNLNSPTDTSNIGRVFDQDEDSFDINAAEISLQKTPDTENPAGFRFDVLAGTDAKLIHSRGLGDADDSVDLQQAYADLNLSGSKLSDSINDLNLKVGKFVTLMGAEVIESKDNWNTSRSYLFGYAIPFTHTGARATYTFDNGYDLILGVNNGWDVTEDNNNAKSLEAHFGLNDISITEDSSLTMIFQGMYGPENEDDNATDRTLGDFIMIYKSPWKPLTLMYNFDYASEENQTGDTSSVYWSGHAGYFRVDLADDWALSGRAEYFDDNNGVRIVSGTPASYTGFTATLEYRPFEDLITRFEYRHDHSSEEVFNDSNNGKSSNQDTLSAEVILVL